MFLLLDFAISLFGRYLCSVFIHVFFYFLLLDFALFVFIFPPLALIKLSFHPIFFPCYLTLPFSCFSFSSILHPVFLFLFFLSLLLDFFLFFQQYFSPDFTLFFCCLIFPFFFFSLVVFKFIFHPDFSVTLLCCLKNNSLAIFLISMPLWQCFFWIFQCCLVGLYLLAWVDWDGKMSSEIFFDMKLYNCILMAI
jgi:hypothetical protein